MAEDPGSTGELEYSLRNESAELVRLNEAVEAFLAVHAVAPQTAMIVGLAMEEAVTNVIKYAYDDRQPHPIAVRVRCTPSQVILAIEDDGRPFDPTAAPPPDFRKPLEERPIGGLGLHLVRGLVQALRYERRGGRNRLEITIDRSADLPG